MTCPTGKIPFVTAARAWREVRRICRNNHTSQSRAYRCKECGQYHLTHSLRTVEREQAWEVKWRLSA